MGSWLYSFQLTTCQICIIVGLRMRRESRERFRCHRGLAISTCIKALTSRMPGSLTSGFLWSRWREKRSQHSRRMRNPGGRPMDNKPLPLSLGRSFLPCAGCIIRDRVSTQWSKLALSMSNFLISSLSQSSLKGFAPRLHTCNVNRVYFCEKY